MVLDTCFIPDDVVLHHVLESVQLLLDALSVHPKPMSCHRLMIIFSARHCHKLKQGTMLCEVRENYQQRSKLSNKIEKVFQVRGQLICTHTHKSTRKRLNFYMVLGMNVESQMEEPNKLSIVKSG